ncbi:hypothetical protein [Streptomyces aquilus]|uniref:hypothetical protein n=1 Tax=Streptomyces aquilus TaxID=2548456 RepID=UPI0036A7253F
MSRIPLTDLTEPAFFGDTPASRSSEPRGIRAGIQRRVHGSRAVSARVCDIVAGALRRAQAAGEVTDTGSPEAQAQLLLYVVQGLLLVSRAGLDRAAALAAIDTVVAGLRA